MSEIYIPTGALALDNALYVSQIRLGIQGMPKTGKTTGAASFPNPIFLSYDRGLCSFVGRADIVEVPFYNDAFVDSIVKRSSPQYVDFFSKSVKIRPPNRKDALIKWLETEGQKLTSSQTLILDGSTGIQAAYHLQYWLEPAVDKEGFIKPYAEYKLKIDYFTEIMMLLKSLRCHVIYISHEACDRDKQGELNGKIRPLLSGAFLDELPSHFTDWYRARVVSKPAPDKFEDFCKFCGVDRMLGEEYIKSTDAKCQSVFLWQTQPDSFAACGTSLKNAPKYIVANYSSLLKYKNK